MPAVTRKRVSLSAVQACSSVSRASLHADWAAVFATTISCITNLRVPYSGVCLDLSCRGPLYSGRITTARAVCRFVIS